MPLAKVGNYELFYVQEGSGPAVVLIHGLAGDHTAWASQLENLKSRYQVLAFDNRGAGLSTQVDEPISTQDMARDTLALMDAARIPAAHVVGRSMGGAIAQYMALLAPTRVRSLVLCASFAKLDPLGARVLTNMRQVLEWQGNWTDHAHHSVQNFVSAEFFNTQSEKVAAIERLIGGETRLPACYIRQNHACLEHDTLNRLREISCPTLIMGGKLDPICSLKATGWLSQGIPRAETVLFNKSSHFFLMEEPKKFAKTLDGWLARHA